MAPVEIVQKAFSRPFKPFRIVMSDGTSHDVTHPELISVSVRTTTLTTKVFETGETLRLDNLHITQLQPISSAPVDNGAE